MEAIPLNDGEESARAMDALLTEDPERWCALKGIMSQFALPTRPLVEIEVAEDEWATVHSLVIYKGGVTFYSGMNGSTVQRPYYRSDPMPRWRLAPRARLRIAGHLNS